jgi:DNA-binding MltR family transcriptional regulator
LGKSTSGQSIEDFGADVMAEMEREFHDEPDRVIAVVGAAYLDAMLERLFRSALIDSEDEVGKLLRPDGPLGSNGARVQTALCLGLITDDQCSDLKRIAKIRNLFAHDFTNVSFDTDPIKGHCAALKRLSILAKMPRKLFNPELAAVLEAAVMDDSKEPREQYRLAVIDIFGSLLRRIKYMRKASHQSWFSYDPDAAMGPGRPAANTQR